MIEIAYRAHVPTKDGKWMLPRLHAKRAGA